MNNFPDLFKRRASEYVKEAHRRIGQYHQRGLDLLGLEEPDGLRLKIVADDLQTHCVPWLNDLRRMEGVPKEWVKLMAQSIVTLEAKLRESASELQGEGPNDGSVRTPQIVKLGSKAGRGRPSKEINSNFLKNALNKSRNLSLTKLASVLGVHRNTLSRKIKQLGLVNRYSQVTDDELDANIREFREEHPDAGAAYVIGFLRSQRIRIQRRRVREALERIDGVGVRLRTRKAIVRRTYQVKRPMAVWHCDGHLKAILWGIAVHGFIDGYSRKVVALRASASNTAETVHGVFKKAVKKYGRPSRVRGDRGTENLIVASDMIYRRGTNRASFLWGTSTHNTRIERLWGEVGRHFMRQWRAFFMRLERGFHLRRNEASHIWLLCELFLPLINKDCKTFIRHWNNHPIGSADIQHMSPNDLFLIGKVKNGVYEMPEDSDSGQDGKDSDSNASSNEFDFEETCKSDNEDGMEEWNGINVHGSENEDFEEWHGINGNGYRIEPQVPAVTEEKVIEIVKRQMNTKHINTPTRRNPFADFPEKRCRFWRTLHDAQVNMEAPIGYGFRPGERGYGEYDCVEMIKVGGRRSNKQRIVLSERIWLPRTVLWVQALETMTHLLIEE